MSDMTGSKAQALARLAREDDRNCIRFDYSGHGASEGEFEDGTISRWLGEAAEIFENVAVGPRVVVGSSMGGWLALLLARQLMAKPEPVNCTGAPSDANPRKRTSLRKRNAKPRRPASAMR